jgi:hypothetical protein
MLPSAMASSWHAFRTAGCLLLASSLAACSDDDEVYGDDIPPPASAGKACIPEAVGTDGCDAISVCVVENGVCHADCDQAACDGQCARYFSPIIEASFSVCFAADEAVPGARTGANPRPR